MPAQPSDMAIGDFSKPVVPPASASPTKVALEAAEKSLDDAARKDEAALQPMKTFEERLKEAGLDKAKAADIVDSVLMQGFYAEDIQITSKVTARLRTRGARDTRRAQEILESERLTIDTHYNESLSRILLASSLERFGPTTLPHAAQDASAAEVEKAFHERMEYVDRRMPDPVLRIMLKKLHAFDRMVSAALEEGTIENF